MRQLPDPCNQITANGDFGESSEERISEEAESCCTADSPETRFRHVLEGRAIRRLATRRCNRRSRWFGDLSLTCGVSCDDESVPHPYFHDTKQGVLRTTNIYLSCVARPSGLELR